jgi:copper homeostasis protein
MSDQRILLEVPVFGLEAAKQAAEWGAGRLELCSSYTEGGLTPGPGLFKQVNKAVTVPVFVMIRPRGGDFVYSESEFEVMKEELRLFKSLGADGFVFGLLDADGSLQKERCKELVELAGDRPCTFHRAFDLVTDRLSSLESVVECGFERILTSGGEKSVEEGLDNILALMKKAGNRIIIMPGGGMTPELIQPLNQNGELREIHASCKRWKSFYGALLPGEGQREGVISVSKNCIETFQENLIA